MTEIKLLKSQIKISLANIIANWFLSGLHFINAGLKYNETLQLVFYLLAAIAFILIGLMWLKLLIKQNNKLNVLLLLEKERIKRSSRCKVYCGNSKCKKWCKDKVYFEGE